MGTILTRRRLLAALLLTTLLAAWAVARAFLDDLPAAEQRWRSAGLINYRYTLQIRCFCPPPMNEPLVVEVQNGATARIRTASSGEEVPLERVGRAGTVPELFAIIRRAREKKADKLDVSFDEALGYPTRISIDESGRIADDESGYLITDLVESPAP